MELLGIVGVCLLLYLISNNSNEILLNILNKESLTTGVMFTNRILLWGGLFLFFLYVRYYLRETFLPWKEKNLSFLKTIFSVIVLLVVLFVGSVTLILLIQSMDIPTQNKETAFQGADLLYQSLSLMIFTSFTAAVLEELLFRGYILPTLTKITNSTWMGVVLSSIVFGLVHFSYGTLHQIIIPIYIGGILSIFYTKYRNLKILIICHFIWNLVAFLDSAGLLFAE